MANRNNQYWCHKCIQYFLWLIRQCIDQLTSTLYVSQTIKLALNGPNLWVVVEFLFLSVLVCRAKLTTSCKIFYDNSTQRLTQKMPDKYCDSTWQWWQHKLSKLLDKFFFLLGSNFISECYWGLSPVELIHH
jgi:hypothetical protein